MRERALSAMRQLGTRLSGRVYSIGIYAGPSPLALAPVQAAANPVLTRDSVADVLTTFVADPFMIRVEGTWYLFFEAMVWRPGLRKGEIACATSPDGLRWTYRGSVLAEPFHLSYPHVFQVGSDLFMVPESTMAGAVRLYRADPFPDRWVLVKELLRGPVLLDNSLFEHDGRWWMLTQTAPDLRGDTLRLFHAPLVTGPWTEHAASPVVRGDARLARPAGRVLSTPEGLLRFAQDCRSAYGVSVQAVRITRLTTTTYEEAEVAGNPVLSGSGHGWNRLGMHHVDAHQLDDGSWLACVDGWSSQLRRPRELLRWAADRLGGPRRGTP